MSALPVRSTATPSGENPGRLAGGSKEVDRVLKENKKKYTREYNLNTNPSKPTS